MVTFLALVDKREGESGSAICCTMFRFLADTHAHKDDV